MWLTSPCRLKRWPYQQASARRRCLRNIIYSQAGLDMFMELNPKWGEESSSATCRSTARERERNIYLSRDRKRRSTNATLFIRCNHHNVPSQSRIEIQITSGSPKTTIHPLQAYQLHRLPHEYQNGGGRPVAAREGEGVLASVPIVRLLLKTSQVDVESEG